MKKAIFKFNSGAGAILCSKCSVIIKTGEEFTDDEWMGMRGRKHINPQYCISCNKPSTAMKEGHE